MRIQRVPLCLVSTAVEALVELQILEELLMRDGCMCSSQLLPGRKIRSGGWLNPCSFCSSAKLSECTTVF